MHRKIGKWITISSICLGIFFILHEFILIMSLIDESPMDAILRGLDSLVLLIILIICSPIVLIGSLIWGVGIKRDQKNQVITRKELFIQRTALVLSITWFIFIAILFIPFGNDVNYISQLDIN